MRFRDEDHELKFHKVLSRMKNQDVYHLAAAYLIALAKLVPDDVFDFEQDRIRPSGVFGSWQTSSSIRATRLMFNLWSGWAYDEDPETNRMPSTRYSVDEIFCDSEYGPYFYEAVKIRFPYYE